MFDDVDLEAIDDIINFVQNLYNTPTAFEEACKTVDGDLHTRLMKGIIAKGADRDDDDMNYVMMHAGPLDDEHNWTDDQSDWDQDVLDRYAEHIENYMYSYKDDDTQEEQIGPLAQDIEQVNPACVDELSDGTKVVDANKLALMNAGAIADLVRLVQRLTDRVEALDGHK